MSPFTTDTQSARVDQMVGDLDDAGELIRGVLHRPMHAFTAADLYRVHGELSVLVPRLAELVGRTRDQLEYRHRGYRLEHDEGGDVNDTVAAHAEHLATAAEALAQAVGALAAAHIEIAHIRDASIPNPVPGED